MRNTETMENFIFLTLIAGISASLSTNMRGGTTMVDKTLRQCDKEGLMCFDCNTLVYCQKDGSDIKPILITECGDNWPCDETKKACTAGGSCRYKEFVCPYDLPEDQLLPDPYSCRLYWSCKKGDPIECDPPFSYNPISNQCDTLMQDNELCLQGPLPLCRYNDEKLNMKGTPFNYECRRTVSLNGKYLIRFPFLIVNTTTPTN